MVKASCSAGPSRSVSITKGPEQGLRDWVRCCQTDSRPGLWGWGCSREEAPT